MTRQLLDRDDEGGWAWNHPALDGEARYETPMEAVEAGIDALRAAVDEGTLSPDEARDIAADARFALGAQEHHLGGPDADAFTRLSAFEDALAEEA